MDISVFQAVLLVLVSLDTVTLAGIFILLTFLFWRSLF